MKGTLVASSAEKVTGDGQETAAAVIVDDGFPPPTHAQIAYWRTLCGAISLTKENGMADDAWPAELAPTQPTLKALAERGIIVRRCRAWHLKRGWYGRVAARQVRAVPTARATLAERPGPDLPSYSDLEACERICRWFDAQPKLRARLPFEG